MYQKTLIISKIFMFFFATYAMIGVENVFDWRKIVSCYLKNMNFNHLNLFVDKN